MRTLSTVPPYLNTSEFLQANSEAYEWFVNNIQGMDWRQEPEAVLGAVERAAWFAGYFHAGRFADGALENLVLHIGAALDSPAAEPPGWPLPGTHRDGRRRVLHVTPGLAMGGHRQLLRHWILNDRDSCHSLVLVDHQGEVPARFSAAVRDSGGSLVALPQGMGHCQKARWLRAMARQNADLVVWHLIGPDVTPTAAFAVDDCPPVVLVDHSDHLFWLGASVADVVLNLRTAGAELAETRRFASRIAVVPIPLLEARHGVSRADARRALGIAEDQVMLLSVGRAEKYRPYGAYDFVATANLILDSQPDAHLYVVGESAAGIAPYLRHATHERLHFVGSLEDPSLHHAAADIYLESFPFGSQTALLEAALSGLAVVPAYAPLFPLLVANDDALADILPNPRNEQEYIERVEWLIREPEQRLALGWLLRERLLVDHVGEGWLERLAGVYAATDRLAHTPRPLPTAPCVASGPAIGLSLWHTLAGGPAEPGATDAGAILGHKAFVAKTVGDYAKARRYARQAIGHAPYRSALWRLLALAWLGKAGTSIRRWLDSQRPASASADPAQTPGKIARKIGPLWTVGRGKASAYFNPGLTALALTAQRLNIRLPAAVLRPLRSLLARQVGGGGAGPGIQDWSTPLIAGREPATTPAQHPPTARPPATTATILAMGADRLRRPKPGAGPASGLKCALVTSALDAGGMDEVVVLLARRLPQQGIRTVVLHASPMGTPDGLPSGRAGRLLREHGVETVELAAAAATRWLESQRPDVISAHGAPPWVLEVAARLSIPYIDTLHGMHSHFNADWAAEAERGQRLAGIVAVSDLVRRQYLHGNPAFPPARIVTIPNGVDDERRLPGDRDGVRQRLGLRDEYLFVSLARHCLQKNSYGLVAAFGDVAAQHPGAHLLIAGRADDPVYFTQVRRLRDRLACRDRIHLRDHTENPAELLAAADGFVLDSFFEGWSLASMEALYAGLPVVLSEVGGAREQVGEGWKRGHVVPNPLGEPLRVDWKTMREARYLRQTNRDALAAAMGSLIDQRAAWLDVRQRLIEESKTRFHPDLCLRGHARALTAAALGKPLCQTDAPHQERA